jgi:pyruvate dehydrogenase E1 component
MDDLDPTETREWLEALDSICRSQGDDRASYILAPQKME